MTSNRGTYSNNYQGSKGADNHNSKDMLFENSKLKVNVYTIGRRVYMSLTKPGLPGKFPKNISLSLQEIRDVNESLKEGGIIDQEIDKAKEYVCKRYPEEGVDDGFRTEQDVLRVPSSIDHAEELRRIEEKAAYLRDRQAALQEQRDKMDRLAFNDEPMQKKLKRPLLRHALDDAEG